MKHKHEPCLPGRMNPCLNCPSIPAEAPMDKIIAVGFGSAVVTRNGRLVLDGELPGRKKFLTFKTAERIAAKNPKDDWRVVLRGPLHGETYQRQGEGKWMLIETNQGFA